jgi:hypothetical protein
MFGSKDFTVSLKGRSGIVYTEGKHKALIEAEMMTGSTDFVIYFDRFSSWQEPYEYLEISEEDRIRIKKNITTELERKGLEIEWE